MQSLQHLEVLQDLLYMYKDMKLRITTTLDLIITSYLLVMNMQLVMDVVLNAMLDMDK